MTWTLLLAALTGSGVCAFARVGSASVIVGPEGSHFTAPCFMAVGIRTSVWTVELEDAECPLYSLTDDEDRRKLCAASLAR